MRKKRHRKRRFNGSYMEDQKLNWNGFPFPNLPFDFESSVCDIHKLLLHEDNKFSAQDSLFWLIKLVSVFSNPVKLKFRGCLNPGNTSDWARG